MSESQSLSQRAREFFSWRVVLAIGFWGVSFPFTKNAIASFHPNAVIALRMWIGGGLLAGWLALRRRPILPERRDLARCTLLGVVLGVHLLIQAFALRLTSSISSGWIIAFNAVILAAAGQIFLGQRIRALGWFGAAIAVLGLSIVALAHRIDAASTGDLLMFASCFTWPLFTLLSAAPIARSGSLRVTTCAMLVAAVFDTLAALSTGWTIGPITNASLAAIVFLGVGCTAIAFMLWMRALDLEGSAKISAMIYFQPFVTMAWAARVDGEPLTTHALVGGPIVVLGVWILRKGTPKLELPRPPAIELAPADSASRAS